MDQHAAMLSEKIRLLSPEQIAEVEDFVEFLRFVARSVGLHVQRNL